MIRRILMTAALALLGASPAPAPAPAARVNIETVTCADLLKASPLDRAAVVMFYWGYAAAKAGAASFRTPILETATEHLMSVCEKTPSKTMLQAVRDTDVKAF